MIYMIEIDYADPASEAEWNAWYDTYLRDLVTVPGIDTGQRFRGITPRRKAHLAVYTLASLAVYGEPRYRESRRRRTCQRRLARAHPPAPQSL